MRELKFRMVTQTTGKFLGYADIYDLLRNGSDVLPDFEEAVLEGVEFEQYTGLKDKNGKEIYEGDIIEQFVCGVHNFKGKKCGRSTIWQVRWNEKECCFELHYLRGSLFADSMMSDGEEYEVIGNIHENPELLGGEE